MLSPDLDCSPLASSYFSSKNECMLMFERVVKTKGAAHTHFQAIGVPKVRLRVLHVMHVGHRCLARPVVCCYETRLRLMFCVQELAPRVVSELETESAKYDMTFKQVPPPGISVYSERRWCSSL